jgi:hypothetical protein
LDFELRKAGTGILCGGGGRLRVFQSVRPQNPLKMQIAALSLTKKYYLWLTKKIK